MEYCVLGDCLKLYCHHCFPVKDCIFKHNYCATHGCCEDKLMTILVTGSCGFIGYHLSVKLLQLGYTVIGIDNLNDYIYDSKFKKLNLTQLIAYSNYTHITDNIENNNFVNIFKPSVIIHLAAYANVRKSNEDPDKFVRNNIEVTTVLLNQIKNVKYNPLFIYASSSSVYGTNTQVPFKETDSLNNIVSPYALSKKTCEDMVTMYCKNFGLKSIGLRFFTVYGPGGRPDMAIYNFLTKIQNEQEITMYGDGNMERDFTYVHDIVNGIINCITLEVSNGKHIIFNLGNNNPIKLLKLINVCETIVGKKARIIKKNIPIGDVPITFADISKAQCLLTYNPTVSIEEGIYNMYQWIKTLK